MVRIGHRHARVRERTRRILPPCVPYTQIWRTCIKFTCTAVQRVYSILCTVACRGGCVTLAQRRRSQSKSDRRVLTSVYTTDCGWLRHCRLCQSWVWRGWVRWALRWCGGLGCCCCCSACVGMRRMATRSMTSRMSSQVSDARCCRER